jgi:hypothetical protein
MKNDKILVFIFPELDQKRVGNSEGACYVSP